MVNVKGQLLTLRLENLTSPTPSPQSEQRNHVNGERKRTMMYALLKKQTTQEKRDSTVQNEEFQALLLSTADRWPRCLPCDRFCLMLPRLQMKLIRTSSRVSFSHRKCFQHFIFNNGFDELQGKINKTYELTALMYGQRQVIGCFSLPPGAPCH
ncbi:hypothetical protein RRG08_062311 [Elysia crispata]|uniref:Uncharacterized protein n=1 Tax=Elysia crispata TaxID=231223 RepID=A0AAE0YHX0_9GAST|nr:hypothetical protein RRG08_062311 [Elysia crispata]